MHAESRTRTKAEAVLLSAVLRKWFLQGDDVLGDGAAEANFFDGDAPLGSADIYALDPWSSTTETFAGGGYSFTPAAMESTDDVATAQSSITNSAAPSVTVADGATVAIDGISGQSVTFAGTTGTLILGDAPAFTGQISGLAGSDALDLSDLSYGSNTTATFLGNTNGGTLTVTDGTNTANIALQGNYLSSSWTLSSDGNGDTIVVDPVSSNNWQTLDVGAGGWVTGIDIAPNDTMVVRTDTYGAYIWNGTEWQQLVTATSMPAGFVTPNDGQGVYEIEIAPSNTNILYMMYDGYVFQSTNEGETWTETSFAPVTDANPNGTYKLWGQKMAVDPENSNVVYVGTPQNGLFVTTNGGTTWQSVGAVPVGLTDSSGVGLGITGIEFDPALGVTGGMTNTIFAASNGNGVYESTNGGATWSAIGGPSDVTYAAVSSTGVYYAADSVDNSLWAYENGAWTELLSIGQEIETVAVDPFNPNEIVTQTQAGQLDISYNAGITWSGLNYNNQLVSTDIPWLADASTNSGQGQWLSIGGTVFDQLVPNELWISDGTGVWNTTNLPTQNFANATVVWNDQSIGIEQLVANEIIVPPGGNPVLASWDRPFFYIDNADVYPSTYGPIESGTMVEGWSIDYASSDPSFLVGLADNWGVEESGYSTDGGQTWTPFASFIPGAGTDFIGGTIAASSPTDIIWAPADGFDPYYTLNGGETWNPITLPGVSDWSGFDWAYYLDARTVTADRVLPNTFYLYYAGYGVYESTNGGSTWTQVYSGEISPGSMYNAELESVPGEAGNLFFTGGVQSDFPSEGFYQSTDQGATWTAVPNVTEVNCFGFGAAAPGQSYPSIYIVGYVNDVYGIWQSTNDAQSWTQIGTYPTNSLDTIKTISGDPNIYGQVYVGFAGSGYAYLLTQPVVTGVAASPSSGIEVPGNKITLTLTMSEVVTVSGTPTLSLNDGDTATYVSGSGTSTLTFSDTVLSSDSDVAALAIIQANLPNGATITDANGNAADLSQAATTFSGLQIDTTAPTISSIADLPSSGDFNAGKVITLTLDFSENVTVNTTGGTPTLTLNDGGIATYQSGSGSTALVFSYTVAAGQSTTALATTAVNLNGATITDGAGYAANLSLSGLTQTGPQISTLTASSLALDGNGFYTTSAWSTSDTVTLTTAYVNDVIILDIAENGTTVSSISDTAGLTWQEKAVAGTGNDLIYQYYAISPNALSADAITVNFTGGATQAELNAFGIAGANTSSPFDTNASIPTTSATGTVSATTSNANDLIFAAYRFGSDASPSAGSGWTAINASGGYYLSEYQIVSATQARLVATASTTDENGGIIDAVVAASAATGPTVSSVVESASSGDLDAGKTVTLTLSLTEAVTVSGGTPTLTLNDGGTATYTGGSGTDALTFSYTVAAGQNTSDLTATAVNLNSATVTDGAGNAANLSLFGLTQSGPQIDTTAPTISSIADSPSSGDFNAGKVITLTLGMSEAVTVAGGTPTLTLNDGGTATYTSGSGTNALTFSYTVAAGQNTPDLTVTAVNLNSATVTDGAGNAANLSLSGLTQGSPQIDTTTPTVSSLVDSPSSGDLDAGKTVTLTLNLTEAVTVAGGSPTLTLNDGGTATYVSGSGTSALTFSYTVAAGQNTAGLTATAVNLNSATVVDGAGNAANLSLSGLTQNGPQIDTTTPTVASVVTSGTGISSGTGDLDAGKTVTLTLNLTEAVTVAGGTPTLTLNDGGTATYSGGSGSSALTFSYTVAAGQNTPDLTVTAVNLNSATVTDGAGNAANLTGAVTNPAGTLQIDTTTSTVSSLVESPASGDLDTGKTVTLTLSLTEAATVSGGTPTLTLNDGGTATYTGGSGTDALTFSYTVAAGQNTSDLTATAVNLNSATITDGAGNAANLSLSGLTQTGPQIDTTPPAAPVITSDTVNGNTVTLSGTAEANSTVTVYDGQTTLGTTTANASGAWSFTTGTLANGTQTLTATATDAAGNTSAASNALDPSIGELTELTGVNAGTLSVANGTTLDITGTVDNTGTITLNASGNDAVLAVVGTATLTGAGKVTLSNNAGNEVASNGASATLTNANNTISGAGTIGDSHLTLINQGTIDANDSLALVVDTGTNTITNSGTLEATSSGGLDIDSNVSNSKTIEALGTNAKVVIEGTISNTTTGFVLASGSGAQVDLDNATISGGTLETSGSNAFIETVSGSTDALDGGTIRSGSTVEINSGTTLALGGTVTNSGTLLVNGGTLNVNGTLTGGTTEISGAGKVVIASASSENVDFLAKSTGQLVLDQATSYTGEISGFGTTQSIDLTDIDFAAGVTISYASNGRRNTSGVLTITEGTNTVSLELEGTYTLANFKVVSDGDGGTLLTDPTVVEQQPGNASATIASGTVLEINTPDSGNVAFTGTTGALWLDQPSTFTGTVSGLGAQNGIDLSGIAFGAQTTLGYSPNSNNTGGTLSLTNGTQSVSIALLGSYMASSFVMESDNHGGTTVLADVTQSANQSLLTNPHHA